ncbi:hypothetical protein AUJ14_02485 [Candidatus Micrarchaeota archaeon CG1_02_55_22]|nr:MAG: hypothetical protein AUJ14_02485 [Candidatus Micrarchaeota archaeon CG1_02_55_22]
MRASFVLSITAFFFIAFGFFVLGASGTGTPDVPLAYGYSIGQYGADAGHPDLLGVLNAFFFVFTASLLFFGFGGIPALAYEAAKYASFSAHGLSWYALLYFFPQLLACYCGTLLAARQADGTLDWVVGKKAVLYLTLAFLVTLLLYFSRPFLLAQ